MASRFALGLYRGAAGGSEVNDLGISLHAHNGYPTFLDAARAAKAAYGISVNPKYLEPSGVRPDCTDSPICEVERTIPDPLDGKVADAIIRNEPFPGTVEDYAALAVDRLLAHLRTHWDASRPTLFAHSSGWDSRILSHCLVTLRDEGFDLGTLHFRCREPEHESFLRVMQRQGWALDQYSVFAPPEKDPMDVGVWERPGVSPWMPVTSQINFWRDIVPYEEERNWNLIGGSGGGEASEYPSLRKAPTVLWRFCENRPVQLWWSYFPDGTDFAADVEARFAKVLFPYFGANHIKTVAQQNPDHLGFSSARPFSDAFCDNIRAAMLGRFKENTLDILRQPRTYKWSISEERWEDMQRKYAASDFARNVPYAPKPDELIRAMRANFFTSNSYAERLWRFAALWEII